MKQNWKLGGGRWNYWPVLMLKCFLDSISCENPAVFTSTTKAFGQFEDLFLIHFEKKKEEETNNTKKRTLSWIFWVARTWKENSLFFSLFRERERESEMVSVFFLFLNTSMTFDRCFWKVWVTCWIPVVLMVLNFLYNYFSKMLSTKKQIAKEPTKTPSTPVIVNEEEQFDEVWLCPSTIAYNTIIRFQIFLELCDLRIVLFSFCCCCCFVKDESHLRNRKEKVAWWSLVRDQRLKDGQQ